METLIRAGVSLLDTLRDLAEDERDSPLGFVAATLADRIGAGATFADAMAGMPNAFTPIEVALVRSGEMTGNLPQVLGEIATSLRWQDELAAQTKKLLMYPSFVLVVISGVVVFLMTYLVPQLVQFIRNMGGTIPFHTRLLIAVSEAFVAYWWLILPAPFVAIALLAFAMRISPRVRRQVHAGMLRLPKLGPILLKLALVRILDTLALMYRSGIPLIEAIGMSREVTGNLVLQEAMAQARDNIASGARLSDGFSATRLFPSLVIRMLRVGENTGQVDEALKNVSYFYSRDIREAIDRFQAMIEPTLTVAMGLLLGWIMLSVLGPIYDTISKIK
jgi:type IV pilus assembly protein PilC